MSKNLTIVLIALLLTAFYKVVPRIDYPAYFPKPHYNFDANMPNNAKIELGRTLFYDPILSKDNTISCASCHSPYNAFAHTDHDLSHGIHDQIGNRNAPALFNLAWQNEFMWDGSIKHLDFQALAPISHPKEMGHDLNSLLTKLNASIQYRGMFFNAFSDSTATGENLLKALSQFQLTLLSTQSKYDLVKQKRATFSKQEQQGYLLYQKKCASCHAEPLFSTYGFANNGLPVDQTLADFGKYNVTKQSKDSLLFKIPSLRNLSYTYPYMHDGRFERLYDVLEHYSKGINVSKTLAKQLRKPIKLSANDKADVLAFLMTLNDKEFVFNKMHQNPIKNNVLNKGK